MPTDIHIGTMHVTGIRETDENDGVFLGTFKAGPLDFHVECLKVERDEDGIQVGTASRAEEMLGNLSNCVEPDGGFETFDVIGADKALPEGSYVVHMYPYSE